MSQSSTSCVDRQHHEFRTYNDSVDVISGWETVFGVYDSYFSKYHFDRFPTTPNDSLEYTPDFTVYFNDQYGITAKILPITLKQKPPQIAEYLFEMLSDCDSGYPIERSDGNEVTPQKMDSVVFVPDSYSSQFGNTLDTRFGRGDPDLDSNVILIRYGMDEERANYIFQRETSLEEEFREDELPNEESLNDTIGPKGGYQSYKLGTREFLRPKTKKPIYNSPPPESYLATYLWMKEFPTKLAQGDFLDWKKGQINKKKQISIDCQRLTKKLNKQSIVDGDLQTEWIIQTLEYLCTTGYAECSNGSYSVMYTGLVRDIDMSDDKDRSNEYQRATELAIKLIRRYCRFGEEADQSGQVSLEDF